MITFRVPIQQSLGKVSSFFGLDELQYILLKRRVYIADNYMISINEEENNSWSILIKNNQIANEAETTLDCNIDNIRAIQILIQAAKLKVKSKQEYKCIKISKDSKAEITIKERPLLEAFLEIKCEHIITAREIMNSIGLDYNEWCLGTLWEYYSSQLWIPVEYINNLPEINFTSNLFLPNGITFPS